MKRRIPKACLWVLTAFCLGFLILYVYAPIANPDLNSPSERLAIGTTFKAGVDSRFGGEIVIFNNTPYGGSITRVGTNDFRTVAVAGWNRYGMYFRSISSSLQKGRSWTFRISIWYPIVLFAIYPALFFLRACLRIHWVDRTAYV